MATYDQLIAYLKGKGYSFSVDVEEVGPTDEWTAAEQEADCCAEVSGADPCVEDGKVEPWDGWDEGLGLDLNFIPSGPSVNELFQRAEAIYGKGNVHLQTVQVGPTGSCGEKITEWVDKYGCCESPQELRKSSGQVAVSIGPEYTYSVVSGSGSFPISWDTVGTGVTVAPKTENSAVANFDDCFCTPAVIYAQDVCESVAPWIVYKSDGSWASVGDETYQSIFGWYQDGESSQFYVLGWNSDITKVSTQHYNEAAYLSTIGEICNTSIPDILSGSPIVTPVEGSQNFIKCESSNIWYREREGFPGIFDVRYPINIKGTNEYTPGVCLEELLYDEENSIEVLAENSSGKIYWSGGKAPYTVRITSGNGGIYFDVDHTLSVGTTNSTNITLYSGDICGYYEVTVSDDCGESVTGAFKATEGSWQMLGAHSTSPGNYVALWPTVFWLNPTNAYQSDTTDLMNEERGKYASGDYPQPNFSSTSVWRYGSGTLVSCTVPTANQFQKYDDYTGVFLVYHVSSYVHHVGGTCDFGNDQYYTVRNFSRYSTLGNHKVYFYEWGC